MSREFKVLITRQVLDDNPGLEDQVKEGETVIVGVVRAVTPGEEEEISNLVAPSDDESDTSGEDYVGTRPDKGRP